MSVTPNVFVPANKAKKAIYCSRNAFGGELSRYTAIPKQEDEDPVLCDRITLRSSDLLITDAAKNLIERNGCNMLGDVVEDPLRPGVLVAIVTDPFKAGGGRGKEKEKTAEQSRPREGRAKEKEKTVEQIKEQAKEAQTLMEKEEAVKKDKEAQTHTNRRNKS
ncbi:hypothetical protein ACE6H2_017956 [Prunus campanulata]